MKKIVLAAVVALMAAPAYASDQQVHTESDTFIVEPLFSAEDAVPPADANVENADVPEGLQALGGKYYRRGWACLWNTGGRYYYTRSWKRSYAYYGGYRACGYRSTCVCTGCYRSGWWAWNGLNWVYWRY